MKMRISQAYNSLPPPTHCTNGQPVPKCGEKFGVRGTRINYKTCVCDPVCAQGQYEVPQYSGRCGTKAQYDADAVDNKRSMDCLNAGNTWSTANGGQCIKGVGGSTGTGGSTTPTPVDSGDGLMHIMGDGYVSIGGQEIPVVYLAGGAVALVVLVMLLK